MEKTCTKSSTGQVRGHILAFYLYVYFRLTKMKMLASKNSFESNFFLYRICYRSAVKTLYYPFLLKYFLSTFLPSPTAFSWFAFFEYLIAIANMFFHFTIIWDFSSLNVLIIDAPRAKLEELFRKPHALKID